VRLPPNRFRITADWIEGGRLPPLRNGASYPEPVRDYSELRAYEAQNFATKEEFQFPNRFRIAVDTMDRTKVDAGVPGETIRETESGLMP